MGSFAMHWIDVKNCIFKNVIQMSVTAFEIDETNLPSTAAAIHFKFKQNETAHIIV